MADYSWPDDLVPFVQSFYLQPHTGRSESPFTRQQKIYGLSAPRWVCRMTFRGGYDGTTGAAGYGRRLDAFLAKLKGGQNRVRLWDFRREGSGSFTHEDILAGATQILLVGEAAAGLAVGDYVGGDGRPHIVVEAEDDGADQLVTVEPPFRSTVHAGDAKFEQAGGWFTLVSDDSGDNLTEVGQLTQYSIELIEDLTPGTAIPEGWIDAEGYGIEALASPFGISLYSDGTDVWPMMEDDGTIDDWLDGGVSWTSPRTLTTWRSISVSKKFDPTLQGTAFNTYYVNYATGADSGAGTTPGAPWKRLNYAKANAVRPALIIVQQDWVGSNSLPYTAYTESGDLKIIGDPPSGGQTIFTQMREAYTKATFAWVDNGDGSWTSAAAGVSDAAKNGAANWELIAGVWQPMAPAVDKATSRATAGTWFNDTTTAPDELTVHLTSGEEPDPGVNWLYAEQASPLRLDIAEGVTAMLENISIYHSTGVAVVRDALEVRPLSWSPASTWQAHDCRFFARNVTVNGASGNGIAINDMELAWFDDCLARWCRRDGLNFHTLHHFALSGDVREGNYMFMGSRNFVAQNIGENGFKNQPAMTLSNQSSSAHERINYLSLNETGDDTYGAQMAHVSGAQVALLNPSINNPTNPTASLPLPALTSPKAGVWVDGAGTRVLVWEPEIRGDSDVTGYVATANGEIVVAGTLRGIKTVATDDGGTVEDEDGNPL